MGVRDWLARARDPKPQPTPPPATTSEQAAKHAGDGEATPAAESAGGAGKNAGFGESKESMGGASAGGQGKDAGFGEVKESVGGASAGGAGKDEGFGEVKESVVGGSAGGEAKDAGLGEVKESAHESPGGAGKADWAGEADGVGTADGAGTAPDLSLPAWDTGDEVIVLPEGEPGGFPVTAKDAGWHHLDNDTQPTEDGDMSKDIRKKIISAEDSVTQKLIDSDGKIGYEEVAFVRETPGRYKFDGVDGERTRMDHEGEIDAVIDADDRIELPSIDAARRQYEPVDETNERIIFKIADDESVIRTDHKDWIVADDIISPRDPASGLPTGKHHDEPVIEPGDSGPDRLVNNEIIEGVFKDDLPLDRPRLPDDDGWVVEPGDKPIVDDDDWRSDPSVVDSDHEIEYDLVVAKGADDPAALDDTYQKIEWAVEVEPVEVGNDFGASESDGFVIQIDGQNAGAIDDDGLDLDG